MKLLQIGNMPNTPYETYLLDSVDEIEELPNSAPAGSMALILTEEDGLEIIMKNGSNEWIAL